MATKQPVIADSGSNEVEQLRLQVNRLTAFVEALQVQIAGNVDYAAFQTDMAAVAVTDMREITLTRNVPPYRQFPTED